MSLPSSAEWKKKIAIFVFKPAEFEVQTPALSAGKRREGGVRTSPRSSSRKIVMAATSGWVNCGSICAWSSISLTKKNPLRSRARIWCGFYKPAWRSVYVFSILCRVCKATLVYQAKSSQTSAQPSPCHRGREKGSNEIPVTMPFRFPALGAGRILLRRPFRCGL